MALNDISFDVKRQELFALLGPNGAGKTTLLHILCTILQPDSGTVRIGGLDVIAHPTRGRRDVGVVFQEPSLDDRLTVHENLNFHGLVYGVPRRLRRQRIDEMIELVELTEWREKLVRTLSSGMKRRVEIARALIHNSRILFLDEPTVGLDAQSRERIWQYVGRLRRQRELTVVVTTHYIEEVEACDRVCIIDRGEILAMDTPAALKAAHGQQLLRVLPREDATAAEIIAAYPDIDRPARRRDHPQIQRRRIRRSIPVALRQPHPPSVGRGAKPGKRVPVADRPRNPRSGGGRARADPGVRSAGRGAHAMTDVAVVPDDRLGRAIRLQAGGLYAIWFREVKRAVRDRGQLIGGVSRPLLWVLIMGIGLNPYFRGEIYGEVRFVVPYTYLQFIFPAVIALNIMYTSVQSAVSVIWDRQFGFLREVLVSPLPRATILLGKVLGGATVALFHGCLVLMLAQFADLSLSLGDIAWGLLLMALLAFGLTSLGIVIAGHIRSFEGFGVFSNAVILPLYFTSSSVFPLDPSLTGAQTRVIYPEWLVLLVRFNPMTYAVDALRGAFIHFHQFEPWMGPTVLVGMVVVFFALALRNFGKA